MLRAYNGWPASRDPADFGGLDNRDVPGAPGVKLAPGVRAGDAAVVLFYFAAQLHARVEPGTLYAAGDEWGWSFRPSKNDAKLLSTHAAGVSFDWNATRHPNGRRGTFTTEQVATIRRIQAEVSHAVYWGGDAWGTGTPDEMHYELVDDQQLIGDVAARLRVVGWTAADPSPIPTRDEDDPLPELTPEEQRRLLKTVDEIAWTLGQMKPQTDRLPEEDAQTDLLMWAIADPQQGLRVQVASLQGQVAAVAAAVQQLSGGKLDMANVAAVAEEAAHRAAMAALGGLADRLRPAEPAPIRTVT